MDSTVMVELTSMVDPKLEEEIQLSKRCIESLRHFHDIFDNAVLTETVVPEDEGTLQELRAALPDQFESLFQRLGLRKDDSVRSIVEMASSLSAVVALTDFQKRKLYDLWHKAYMKLHFLLGRLNHRKERLEALSSGKDKTRKLLASLIFLIVVVVIALVVYLFLRFGSGRQ